MSIDPLPEKQRVFNPLIIPKGLQASLPFKSKPKVLQGKKNKRSYEARRKVVMDKSEKQLVTLMNQLTTIKNVKEKKKSDKQKREE